MSIGAVGVPPCNGRVMSRSAPFAVDPSISRSEILHHPHDTSVCSIAAGRESRDLLRRPRAPPLSPSTPDAVLFMALTLRTTVASTKRKVRSRLVVEENREQRTEREAEREAGGGWVGGLETRTEICMGE